MRMNPRHRTMPHTSKSERPLLGAHESIAGGVGEALIRGERAGCECIQIFTKSSRQWVSKPLSNEEIDTFKRNKIKTGITTVIAHDSYLVNLGAPDKQMRTKRSEEHTSELQSLRHLVCRLLLEKKKTTSSTTTNICSSTSACDSASKTSVHVARALASAAEKKVIADDDLRRHPAHNVLHMAATV